MIARGTEAATAPSPFSSEQQRRFDEGFEWAVNKYPPERRKSALLAVLHVAAADFQLHVTARLPAQRKDAIQSNERQFGAGAAGNK